MKPEFSIVPEREPIELDPQRCFSARQKAEIFANAKGRCKLCKKKVRGKWIAGHIKAHSLGGPTTVANGRVECMDCAGDTHAEDTSTAAKCERMAQRTGQAKRRAARTKPLLQTRGFEKRFKKKFSGQVIPRTE